MISSNDMIFGSPVSVDVLHDPVTARSCGMLPRRYAHIQSRSDGEAMIINLRMSPGYRDGSRRKTFHTARSVSEVSRYVHGRFGLQIRLAIILAASDTDEDVDGAVAIKCSIYRTSDKGMGVAWTDESTPVSASTDGDVSNTRQLTGTGIV
jgi:hypothetical protein